MRYRVLAFSRFNELRTGRLWSHLWAASLILALSTPAVFAAADFTHVVTFGDSLTHNDPLGWYSGKPQDLYGADPMEAVFAKAATEEDKLNNYAVAGSQSARLGIQVSFYELFRRSGSQDTASLLSIEIGALDVLGNVNLLGAHPPGQHPPADAVIDQLIANIAAVLEYLQDSHPDAQFVLWTVPDVTLIPDHWHDLTVYERGNIRAHIQRVNQWIQGLAEHASVTVFDLYAWMQQAMLIPPVILGHRLVPPPALGNYDHLFADDLHPTAVTNALIANAIIKQINLRFEDTIPLYTETELAALARIPSLRQQTAMGGAPWVSWSARP
jgi:phospholipase/lecithinase/hemolysin